jgi:crotonobetainyl-CoA:carnitine CoA-transferase CaiB-like acyl-CoA transferase
MILGDLGADVIKIEPPGGSGSRQMGPFLSDAENGENSLQFFAYNRNKRSIVLDPAASADIQVLEDLIRGADMVLESSPPGSLARYGLDFAALCALNPTIVHVVVSPFGVDGPAADRIANDLTLSALGGQVGLQGSPDRAPVRVSIPQAWHHASAQAAAAAVIAHARMQVTGEPQFVDLSAQCSVTWTMMNAMDAHAVQGFEFQRMGSMVQMGTRQMDPVFECADGHLVAVPTGMLLNTLLGHIAADDLLDADWLTEDWETFDARLLAEEETRFSREEVRDVFVRYFKLHPKEELFRIGFEAGVTLAPINTVADLVHFEQLDAREAWQEVTLPDGTNVRTPGVFAKLDESPIRLRLAPPRLDEHGAEIRAELTDGIRSRATLPTPRPQSEPGADYPWQGLKVLDLTWVIAGPATARYFADHGATVVKVESETRPDALRLLGPVRGEPGWNCSHFYGEMNAGKKCIQLNLKEPRAVEILKELIAWADVLIENWAPGATERLGIDYTSCQKINPELIMVSTSLLGQYGPFAGIAGFGYHAAGMAGFYEVTGWSDMPPHGPWMAYTDVIAPHFIVATVGAALDHRRRTGKGQHIDAAQFEMSLQFLTPEILDAQASGYVADRMGNRKRDAAPQGVYPCAGEDEWVAIAVDTDAQWSALVDALGSPDWASQAALRTTIGRIEQHDQIDARLAEWTGDQTPHAVMDRLTAAGVPAGAVQRSRDLAEDPQYAHRGFHHHLDHPVLGSVPYAGNQFRIPGYPGGPIRPSPLLGEHNLEILGGVLGYSEAEIAELMASGAAR